ncbi:MAG: hypothetical protein K2X74_22970 [Acetobacteraceae bacterium]|nr:hypothetical protein [Acetobacteraceae bacterium]
MTKDYDILLEKEKVFDEYRSVNDEIKSSKALAKQLVSKLKRLEKNKESLARLIAVMIEHGCDPVEAKLKYGNELKKKRRSKYDDDDDDELDLSNI